MSDVTHKVDADEVRASLASILSHEPLSSAPRLQAFLTHIVEETLQGRDEQIVGKNIAEKVYGRKAGPDWKDEPIVRVDAGRLRRGLETYYSSAGRDDKLEIQIPVGAYKPRFTARQAQVPPQAKSADSKLIMTGLAALAVAAAVVMYLRIHSPEISDSAPVHVPQTTHDSVRAEREKIIEIERQAMFDKSPASLQAYVFAQKARELIFPPTDPVRLQSALDNFQQVIELDADYHGGHAGTAQVYAFQALFSPPGKAAPLLAKARAAGRKAQEMAPTNAWVQSTLGWIAFVAGEFDKAVELANRSIQLDRHDPQNRSFNGMILGFTGDFDAARRLVEPYLDDIKPRSENLDLNIYAVTSFNLGEDVKTIEAIKRLVEAGRPTGALVNAHLSAAYWAQGEHTKAAEVAKRLFTSWPRFNARKFFGRLYKNPQHAERIVTLLQAAKNHRPAGGSD